MSSRKGSANRSRPQKHQNTTAWKVDKFHNDPKTKLVQNLVVTNCCEKCTGVIEWKIRYGKYKPLNQPAKCTQCHEKRVKYAYHIVCSECVEKLKVCAKCGQKEAEIVRVAEPTVAEDAKLQAELQKELKALPERRRRTFLRYLKKQEEGVRGKAKNAFEESGASDVEAEEAAVSSFKETEGTLLNTARKEALTKLRELTEKFGRKEKDFDDFDLDDLGLSEDEDSGAGE